MPVKKKKAVPEPEKKIPVPIVTLDVSIQYKDVYLNNTIIDLYDGTGVFDSGEISLDHGDVIGQKKIIVSKTDYDLWLRVERTPKVPQDDTSYFPVLGHIYHFGEITSDTRVMIVVAEQSCDSESE